MAYSVPFMALSRQMKPYHNQEQQPISKPSETFGELVETCKPVRDQVDPMMRKLVEVMIEDRFRERKPESDHDGDQIGVISDVHKSENVRVRFERCGGALTDGLPDGMD